MDTRLLSNTLATLSSGSDFAIYGDVNNESDYGSNVIFVIPANKPSWSEVQSGQSAEQWKVVRGERDRKLLSCDWTQLGDVTMSGELLANWQSYRQSLRDVPTQSDPFNITWPTPPA
ncbi:MAG: tail fiber assembly protein [Anaerolineales bacterium]|nr:tail fiber assembly protein [Anaerolineales bacterium]|tara:strand:+ start:207 stop:557 length:351 start_codon:yes stop_codon:yes gene_type:complete